MIYTVGHEQYYDRQLAGPAGRRFRKLGCNGSYPGGFAVRTPVEAARLIQEWNKQGDWAVYELEADWEKDTKPSLQGWWHALQRDARIVRKVPTPSLLPLHPEHWQVEAEPVMHVNIVAPMEESDQVLSWIYNRGGRTTSSGPVVVDFPKVDSSRIRVIGYVPLTGLALPMEDAGDVTGDAEARRSCF